MKTIILSELYPQGVDLRQQIRRLAEIVRNIPEQNEQITIDVNDACLSRSAMDEFYKTFVNTQSNLARRTRIINKDDDYNLKLKAVIRSQNVKKHLRKFDKSQIITIRNANEMASFVNSI